MSKETVEQQNKHGTNNAKGTFIVNILFQQNATWQGNILWLETNKKQNFRSVLEMIRLMDEVLIESTEDEKPRGWEQA